jgi:hypothetical protein
MSFSYPGPSIFLGRIEGHYSADMVSGYIRAMGRALEPGPSMWGFHDWYGMTGYDSICRKEMTDWVLARLSKMNGHHLLVHSKMVAMGVATANLVLGGNALVSHTDRASFERALATVRSA